MNGSLDETTAMLQRCYEKKDAIHTPIRGKVSEMAFEVYQDSAKVMRALPDLDETCTDELHDKYGIPRIVREEKHIYIDKFPRV